MDEGKVYAARSWPSPTTVKELQRFLGFANFYRQFIWNYSLITAPLTSLLKAKPKSLQLNSEADAAFSLLKKAFATTPILTLPDPGLPFVVEVDASQTRVGAVLSRVASGLPGALGLVASGISASKLPGALGLAASRTAASRLGASGTAASGLPGALGLGASRTAASMLGASGTAASGLPGSLRMGASGTATSGLPGTLGLAASGTGAAVFGRAGVEAASLPRAEAMAASKLSMVTRS